MPDPNPIVVLGGTGHYGRLITRSLRRLDASVRVLSRRPDAARRLLGDEVEVVAGDLESPETVRQVVDGARALVVSVSAANPRQIRRRLRVERDAVLGVLDAAREQGVRRVVCLSGYELREEVLRDLGLLDFGRPLLDVEAALAASDLDWTVLGSAPSMEIYFAMLRGDRMMVPGGGPPALPTVSQLDVGEVAARAVLRDDLGGRRFRLPGPEALSFPEAASRISAVWGRTIRVRRIPLLPLRIAAAVAGPFYPFLPYMVGAIRLMNGFPEDLAAAVPEDHRLLVETFGYTPTTLEEEAQRRGPAAPRPHG